MKLIINIILTIVVAVSAYFLFKIINDPIRLKKVHLIKKEAIVNKLEDIRTAQFAYKTIKNKFAGNWDSLINTIRDEKFTVIKIIGDPNEEDSIKLAQIERDTIFEPVLDSIFSADYPIDSLKYIPYAKGAIFKLESDIINQRGVDVPVFQVTDSEPYDPEDILILGSLEEINYSGNWK